MIPANKWEIEQFWASELGTTAQFLTDGPTVSCTAQQLYSGVQLFLRESRLVVASPASYADFIAAQISGLPPNQLFSVEFVERLLYPDVEKVLGPAHVSYSDLAMFRPSSSSFCRLLTPNDVPIYNAFASTLSEIELERSGFQTGHAPAFGVFDGDELCAVAYYEHWKPRIAHIMVATHPARRRQGYGRTAVTALAEHALALGLILQWRALESNTDSLGLAKALGFQHYCSTIFARIRLP